MRESNKDYEAVLSGKNRSCCHVGLKEKKKNEKSKKEQEKKKPPTHLKWMQNEVIVRERAAWDAASFHELWKSQAEGSWHVSAKPSINEHRMGYVSLC